MKIQNILRLSTTVAFGIAFMWASVAPVHAQEIVNTEFPNGPYVSSFDQTAATLPPAAPATASSGPANIALTPPAVPTPAVAEQAVLSASDYLRDTLIASSFFGLLLFVAYAIAEVRRNAFPSRPRFTRRAALS
jgi:hypothetical protein